MSLGDEIRAIDSLIDWLKAKLEVRPASASRLRALKQLRAILHDMRAQIPIERSG